MAFYDLFPLKIIFSILAHCLEIFEYPTDSQNVKFYMSPKLHGNQAGKYYVWKIVSMQNDPSCFWILWQTFI